MRIKLYNSCKEATAVYFLDSMVFPVTLIKQRKTASRCYLFYILASRWMKTIHPAQGFVHTLKHPLGTVLVFYQLTV